MGLKIPQDISITGFDGVELTQFVIPRLTTVKQRKTDLAKKGLAALLENIEKEELEPEHILVPFELIKGESVLKVN